MAVVTSGVKSRELDQTPTWAVAVVCAIIILISIALEKGLHKVGAWFTAKQKKAMFEAMEKVKAELMILGFISLLLTFSQYYIADICIPIKVANTLLPCPLKKAVAVATATAPAPKVAGGRRLFWYDRRILAGGSKGAGCKNGKVPLITVEGLHQLHILIFFMAVLHVIYSAATMGLGRLKIRGWRQWEQETLSHDYEVSNDPSRFRLTHETSFVRAHTSSWTRIPIFFYIGCFFRQFFKSVSKSDYLTLRNGFVSLHLAPGSKFNFQRYIKRSLEDDFKTIVGVTPFLWATFVFFLLININGWQTLFWASLIPLIIILGVGTKLQAILTKMALDISERTSVVQGMPLVEGSDKYFWFGKPELVLQLIHFALFQNAFQLTYFLWIWYKFELTSCLHNNFGLRIAKVFFGIGLLFLCSYITLPLYALVAQMGSQLKKSIFDEHTSRALENWRKDATKKKNQSKTRKSATIKLGAALESLSSTLRSSSTLKRHRSSTGTGNDSNRSHYSGLDTETELSTNTQLYKLDGVESNINEFDVVDNHEYRDEFSFGKSTPPQI